jgi:hypothetical protein
MPHVRVSSGPECRSTTAFRIRARAVDAGSRCGPAARRRLLRPSALGNRRTTAAVRPCPACRGKRDRQHRGLSRPNVDAVLGPAVDGGCWSIGLKRPVREGFDDVPISVAHTAPRSARECSNSGCVSTSTPCAAMSTRSRTREPARLLTRLDALLKPSGDVLVELDPPRCRNGDGDRPARDRRPSE